MKNQRVSLEERQVILWRDLLDLGVKSSLTFLQKRSSKKIALRELRKSLLRQSEEHWQGLYDALKRLK